MTNKKLTWNVNEFLHKIYKFIKKILWGFLQRITLNISKTIFLRRTIKKVKKTNNFYSFSKHDIRLYVHERYTVAPLLKENEINIENSLVEYSIRNIRIWFPQNNSPKDLPYLYNEVFNSFCMNPSSYNHPEMDYSNTTWVLDAGASEGFFSIFALMNTMAHIFVVEPMPNMRIPLTRTLDNYAEGSRYSILTAALGDQIGSCEIIQDNDHVCNTTVKINDGMLTDWKNSIPVMTIDQINDNYDLEGRGMIKMDIEGFEMKALMGATVVLSKHKPKLAIAVYHGLNNARECASIILKANPTYKIEYRGMYGWDEPARPYMLFAY